MNDIGNAVGAALATIRAHRPSPPGPGGSLPAVPPAEAKALLARPPSAPLAAAVRAAAEPGLYVPPGGEPLRIALAPLRVAPEVAEEAKGRWALVASVLSARVEPRALVKWLYQMSQSVERPPAGEALDEAVRALASDLRDLPAICFTDETRRDIARELVFWPSFAKLEPALRRRLAPLEAEARRLEAVAKAAAGAPRHEARPAPCRAPPTPEQVARNRETVAALRAGAEERGREAGRRGGAAAAAADIPSTHEQDLKIRARLLAMLARAEAEAANIRGRLRALRARNEGREGFRDGELPPLGGEGAGP